MENKEDIIKKIDKVTETLIKELEGLNEEGLHEFFMFFCKMNHQHGNMIAVEKFEEFLKAFDHNPFTIEEQLKEYCIENECLDYEQFCLQRLPKEVLKS